MKKKKILHIQVKTIMSGSQNVMMMLLDNLPKDEYDIYVASQPTGELVNVVKERGYTHIPLKFIRRNLSVLDFFALIELYFIMKKYKFDIVHTHSAKPGFLGRIAARLAKIPKIIHTHHGVPYHQNQFFLARGLYILTEYIASRFAHKVVFMNKSEYNLSVKYGLVPKTKASVIYNGYKIKETTEKEEHKNFVIGNVARFEKQKNHKNVIDVAIQVCLNRSDVEFIFVGSGSLFKEIFEKVQRVALEKRIRLVGWQNNADMWYPKFDVFLMFTLWEGMPLSIMEAMNYSLPIVASDIPGNDELVTKENGFLVNLKDKQKLIDLLTELPDMKEKLIKMGKKSHEILEENFNLKKFVKGYLELYND